MGNRGAQKKQGAKLDKVNGLRLTAPYAVSLFF
jgi:hypothetical protein